MNKSTIQGIIIGVVIASAGAVIANYTAKHSDSSKSVEVAEEVQNDSQPLDTESLDEALAAEDAIASGELVREEDVSLLESELAPTPAPAPQPREEPRYQEPAPRPAPRPTYAEVLSVTPATETESTPREVCEQVEVVEQAPVKDENQIVGTVAGAVIGGLLGNQVGGGSGKKVATVAGAAAGGFAGKKVQEGMQQRNTTTRMETRCETVYDEHQVQRGFDVAYRLNGREDSVRMDYDPGSRIPVENGQLVIRR